MLYLTTTLPKFDKVELTEVSSVEVLQALTRHHRYKLVATPELGTEMSQSLGLDLTVSDEEIVLNWDVEVYVYTFGRWFIANELHLTRQAEIERVERKSFNERVEGIKRRVEAFGLNTQAVIGFMDDEACGVGFPDYLDDSGRDRLAASAGLSRQQLDALLHL